jgi:hypothetical protein
MFGEGHLYCPPHSLPIYKVLETERRAYHLFVLDDSFKFSGLYAMKKAFVCAASKALYMITVQI